LAFRDRRPLREVARDGVRAGAWRGTELLHVVCCQTDSNIGMASGRAFGSGCAKGAPACKRSLGCTRARALGRGLRCGAGRRLGLARSKSAAVTELRLPARLRAVRFCFGRALSCRQECRVTGWPAILARLLGGAARPPAVRLGSASARLGAIMRVGCVGPLEARRTRHGTAFRAPLFRLSALVLSRRPGVHLFLFLPQFPAPLGAEFPLPLGAALACVIEEIVLQRGGAAASAARQTCLSSFSGACPHTPWRHRPFAGARGPSTL